MLEPNLEALRREVEAERLRDELERLRSPPNRRMEARRSLIEWLTGGGVLLAAAGFAVNYVTSDRQALAGWQIERCKRAADAVTDDRLNDALSQSEQQVYIRRQLRILRECEKDLVP